MARACQSIGVIVALHAPEQGGVLFGGVGQVEVLIGRFALVDRDGSTVERLGVGVFRLLDVNDRELIQDQNAVDMVRAQVFLLEVERPLEKRFRLAVFFPRGLDQRETCRPH